MGPEISPAPAPLPSRPLRSGARLREHCSVPRVSFERVPGEEVWATGKMGRGGGGAHLPLVLLHSLRVFKLPSATAVAPAVFSGKWWERLRPPPTTPGQRFISRRSA